LDIAEYHLSTANAMFDAGRWLFVAFMCQQAIEALVKGLYILYIDDNIPKIYNIGDILKKFESKLSSPMSEETYIFLDKLSRCYIKMRYTDYNSSLRSKCQ
jgi:HEPN domain-containing protein